MAIASSRRLCAVSRLFAASARSVTGVSSVWVIFTAALIWVPPNRRIDTPQSENRTSRPLGIGGESEAGAAGIRWTAYRVRVEEQTRQQRDVQQTDDPIMLLRKLNAKGLP